MYPVERKALHDAQNKITELKQEVKRLKQLVAESEAMKARYDYLMEEHVCVYAFDLRGNHIYGTTGHNIGKGTSPEAAVDNALVLAHVKVEMTNG